MHISEGILTATPLAAGTLAALAGTAIGLRRLDEERIPQAALLGSAFFVASAIQVPMFGSSVHLVLSGLMGLVLGWAAFPTVLVALILQLVFCSIGGPTTLGINTLVMALPAVFCHYAFREAIRSPRKPVVFATGFAAGAVGLLMGAVISAVALVSAGEPMMAIAQVFLAAHVPLAAVEGLVTGSVVVLLRQVRPEMLRAAVLAPAVQEVVDV